jgi:hypothetical protein
MVLIDSYLKVVIYVQVNNENSELYTEAPTISVSIPS